MTTKVGDTVKIKDSTAGEVPKQDFAGLAPHQLGWKCPSCGVGNAPWVASCPRCAAILQLYPQPTPPCFEPTYLPYPWLPTTWCSGSGQTTNKWFLTE